MRSPSRIVIDGIGLVFFIVGLVNRDKWSDEAKWSDLTQRQRTMKLLAIGGLTLLLVLGVLYYVVERGAGP